MSRSSGTTANPPFASRSAFEALTVDDVEDFEDEQQEEETLQTQVTRFVFTGVCDLAPT
jgi:phosphatidate cytidylyltransferase